MYPSRAAELAETSRRLIRTASDLRGRAYHAVQGSRDVVESARLTRRARAEWTALWPALRRMPASGRVLVVCSVCRRARTPSGAWTLIPARILDHLQAQPGALPLSHGVCPSCLRQQYGIEMEEMDTQG